MEDNMVDILTGIILLLFATSLLMASCKERKIKILALIPIGVMVLLTVLGYVIGI